MIEPRNGAEQLYVRNLAAYRVRAIHAATAGEPYAYLDEAFREAVKRVGRTFESRNDGLVEWAELLAREVLAGKAVPGVDALILDADAIAADKAELADLAAGVTEPDPEPEPEKKAAPGLHDRALAEMSKRMPATQEKPAARKAEPEKKAEARDEKKAEARKAEARDEKKAEARKAEPEKKAEPKKAEPEKKAEPKKAEAATTTVSVKKAEPEKTETPRTETTKDLAQKTSDDWYTMSGKKVT